MSSLVKVSAFLAAAVLSTQVVSAGGTLIGGIDVTYEMNVDTGSTLAAEFATPWNEPGTSCDSEGNSVTVFFTEGWDNGNCKDLVASFEFEVAGGVVQSSGTFTIACQCGPGPVPLLLCQFEFLGGASQDLPTNGTTADFGDDTTTFNITVETSVAPSPAVPTLDEWGMIVAVFGLMLAGVFLILRRRAEGGHPA